MTIHFATRNEVYVHIIYFAQTYEDYRFVYPRIRKSKYVGDILRTARLSMSLTSQLGATAIVVSAIGVTVGLAWNNAISSIINHYIPDEANNKSMWVKILYAVGLTVLASFVAKIIDKYSNYKLIG